MLHDALRCCVLITKKARTNKLITILLELVNSATQV